MFIAEPVSFSPVRKNIVRGVSRGLLQRPEVKLSVEMVDGHRAAVNGLGDGEEQQTKRQ